MEKDVKKSIKSILAVTVSFFAIVFSLIKLVLHFQPHILIDNSTKIYNVTQSPNEDTGDGLYSKSQPSDTVVKKLQEKKTNDISPKDLVQQPENHNQPISQHNLQNEHKTLHRKEIVEKAPENEPEKAPENEPKNEPTSLVEKPINPADPKQDNGAGAKDPKVVTEELTKLRDKLDKKFQAKTHNNKGDETQKEPLNRHKKQIKEDEIKKDKKDAFERLDKEFGD